jgi:hypothetical protein
LDDSLPKICSHTNVDASVGIQEAYWTDHPIRHLIYLVTLIINIYGLGVGISTIKRFTSGRGFLSFVVSENPHP